MVSNVWPLDLFTSPRWCSPEGMPSPPSHPVDLSLAREVLAGEADAMEAFIERMACVPRLVREGHRRLGGSLDEHELDDVTQETLAAIWIKLGGFEGRAALETWAFRFGRNELLKAFEKKRRRGGQLEPDPAELTAKAPPEETSIDPVSLHARLNQLDNISAAIVRARHFDQRSFQEIASSRSEPLGTVKTRYYRAIDRLREALDPEWRRVRS